MQNAFFVSYSHADRDVARAVNEALERVLPKRYFMDWADGGGIKPGEDWELRLRTALKASRAVLHLYSCSAAHSEYVQKELEIARQEGLPILTYAIDDPDRCPLRLPACTRPDAAEIRSRVNQAAKEGRRAPVSEDAAQPDARFQYVRGFAEADPTQAAVTFVETEAMRWLDARLGISEKISALGDYKTGQGHGEPARRQAEGELIDLIPDSLPAVADALESLNARTNPADSEVDARNALICILAKSGDDAYAELMARSLEVRNKWYYWRMPLEAAEYFRGLVARGNVAALRAVEGLAAQISPDGDDPQDFVYAIAAMAGGLGSGLEALVGLATPDADKSQRHWALTAIWRYGDESTLSVLDGLSAASKGRHAAEITAARDALSRRLGQCDHIEPGRSWTRARPGDERGTRYGLHRFTRGDVIRAVRLFEAGLLRPFPESWPIGAVPTIFAHATVEGALRSTHQKFYMPWECVDGTRVRLQPKVVFWLVVLMLTGDASSAACSGGAVNPHLNEVGFPTPKLAEDPPEGAYVEW